MLPPLAGLASINATHFRCCGVFGMLGLNNPASLQQVDDQHSHCND
jgi:hypothetical protein